MADQDNEQKLREDFEAALSTRAATTEALVDPCTIYRLIPQGVKDALGRWIENKFGSAAKRFYDALIQIADNYCRQ